jgi:hypothetical protein
MVESADADADFPPIGCDTAVASDEMEEIEEFRR